MRYLDETYMMSVEKKDLKTGEILESESFSCLLGDVLDFGGKSKGMLKTAVESLDQSCEEQEIVLGFIDGVPCIVRCSTQYDAKSFTETFEYARTRGRSKNKGEESEKPKPTRNRQMKSNLAMIDRVMGGSSTYYNKNKNRQSRINPRDENK